MTIQNCSHSIHRLVRPDGFILLEVLVAMSLILGAWMVSANTYQRLALNLNQQETKRAEIRRQIDSHELETYFKAVAQHEAGSIKDELARMSGRTHALRSTSKPLAKGKR